MPEQVPNTRINDETKAEVVAYDVQSYIKDVADYRSSRLIWIDFAVESMDFLARTTHGTELTWDVEEDLWRTRQEQFREAFHGAIGERRSRIMLEEAIDAAIKRYDDDEMWLSGSR